MVQQSLIEYVQKLLQQGYDANAIRTALQNAGYTANDIEAAMETAGAPTRKVGTRTLIVAFLILLVLAGGVLILLKALQPPPVVLSFSISLFSTKIALGQDIAANIDIINPSGRKTTGLLDLVIEGPAGRIASKTEGFTLTERTSIPSIIALPPNTSPGTYTLKATISYDGTSEYQSASFEAVEKIQVEKPAEALKEKAVEKAKEIQQTCPGGCDDLNFCTTDECKNGECINTPITPCCGNKNCETGESESSCPLDCGEKITPDEMRQRAKEQATSNIPKAVETCNSMAQRMLIDACLSDVSEASGDKNTCAQIVNTEIRDACYIPFAYKNDFSVCAEIQNPYMKNSCTSLEQLSNIKASLPQT